MDNFNYRGNLNNDEWISLSEPVMAESVSLENLENFDVSEEKDESMKKPKEKKSIKAPIVTFQLTVCLLALIFLFVAKTFLPDMFNAFKTTYDREIKSTMYSSGDFKSNSYLSFFTSTPDEV